MSEVHLERRLSLTDGGAIVIGSIIGTGVFLKTATMAQLCGNIQIVLLAWFVAGVLSFAGALTYAELGSVYNEAGGEYIYLKKSYGGLLSYLYGWMRFFIASPGSIAAYSVGAATFLHSMYDLSNFGGIKAVSVLLIIFFSIINCLAVAIGGKLQTIMTAIKMLSIFLLIGGILFLTKEPQIHSATSSAPFNINQFGAAVLAALWAFDGWNNLPMVAGEIKNPRKNIPLSLIIGVGAVFVIYALTNFSYFYALPLNEVLSSNSSEFPDALPVATKAANIIFGPIGLSFITIAMFISATGAMNGSVLTSARVPYAMAHEGDFFKFLGKLHPKTHVPVNSVLIQMLLAIILALSGSFDQLTDYVVFASWLFYALTAGVIFMLRKKFHYHEDHYKMFGFPIIPLVFIILAILLLFNTIYMSPKSSFIGLIIILTGVPFYYLFHKKRAS